MSEAVIPSVAPSAARTQSVAAAHGAVIDERSLAEVRVTSSLLGAALSASLIDAVQTFEMQLRAHESVFGSLLASVEAFGMVSVPLLLAVAPLTRIARLSATRRAVRGAFLALGANDEDVATTAVVLFAALFGASVLAGASFGHVILGRFGPLVAVNMLVVQLALMFLVTPVIAAFLAHLAVRARRGLASRWPIVDKVARVPSAGFMSALALLPWFFPLLPASLMLTFSGGVFGGLVGANAVTGRGGRDCLGVRRVTALLPVLLLAGSLTFVALPRLPPAVQVAIAHQAPTTSFLLGVVRSFSDEDGDGYSPILLGGDCDDGNASIHPGAHDIPGNGIDENCSGADATLFAPALQEAEQRAVVASQPLNIVLIHLDAQRVDHMGIAGYRRPTTRREDEFKAKFGIWFDHAYTPAGSTRFAMSSLFTGLDIGKIPQSRGNGMDFTLLPEAVTVASQLGSLGYARIGYTNSYTVQHIFNVGQGFEQWGPPWPVDEWEQTYRDAAERTTAAATQFLAARAPETTQPYLLFLHYQCTHDPYIKHDLWDYGDKTIDVYDSALSYCDEEVGQVLSALEAREDWGRAAVILYSDHGEEFGEHGFAGHGYTVADTDVRVLLMMRIPGVEPKVVTSPVSLTDVAPTLLALAGHVPDLPGSTAWNLLPLAGTGDAVGRPDRPTFLYADVTHSGVRTQGRGVVRNHVKYMRDISSGAEQLYRLDVDPDELHNLAAVEPRLRAQLADLTESWDSYTSGQ